MAPLEWFDSLNIALTNTKCRLGGENTEFNEGIKSFQSLLLDIRKSGNSVYWVGNGGSNAICSHLSQDLMNKMGVKSFPFTDSALITCAGNDFGYENVFSHPLMSLLSEGDILIVISSSGNSKNILNAVAAAKQKQAKVIALSSFAEDNLLFQENCDISFYLPAQMFGLAEIGHSAILHAAIDTLELSDTVS